MNRKICNNFLCIIIFSFINISCLKKEVASGIDSLNPVNLNLENLVNYHVFEDRIIFLVTDQPVKRKHYKNLEDIRYVLYSYDLKTKKTDSTSFLSRYYLSINAKLNDSLFAIGYHDHRTALLWKRLQRYNFHVRDTIVTLKEHLRVYNTHLSIVDSLTVSFDKPLSTCNHMVDFVDYAKDRTIDARTFSGEFYYDFPVLAGSYAELQDKYGILFKYNKFWCRHSQVIDRTTQSGDSTIGDPSTGGVDTISTNSDYWHILFDTEYSYLYQFTNPALYRKTAEQYLWAERKEIVTYYWSRDMTYSDTLIGETDYIVQANSGRAELLIARKTLPFYQQAGSVEKFRSFRIKTVVGKAQMNTIALGNLIPRYFIDAGPNRYLVGGINKDSVRALQCKDSLESVQNGQEFVRYPCLYYWSYPYSMYLTGSFGDIPNQVRFLEQISFGNGISATAKRDELWIIRNNKTLIKFPAGEAGLVSNISRNSHFILVRISQETGDELQTSKFYYLELEKE